jgi:hypothetical protein
MNEKNPLTIELIPEFIILGLQDCNLLELISRTWSVGPSPSLSCLDQGHY